MYHFRDIYKSIILGIPLPPAMNSKGVSEPIPDPTGASKLAPERPSGKSYNKYMYIYIFSRANLCSHFGSFGDSLLSPTCGRLRLPRLRGHHVRRGVPHRIKLLQRQCWSGVSISLSHCFRDCGRNINQTRYKPAHIADSRYDFARLL